MGQRKLRIDSISQCSIQRTLECDEICAKCSDGSLGSIVNSQLLVDIMGFHRIRTDNKALTDLAIRQSEH